MIGLGLKAKILALAVNPGLVPCGLVNITDSATEMPYDQQHFKGVFLDLIVVLLLFCYQFSVL